MAYELPYTFTKRQKAKESFIASRRNKAQEKEQYFFAFGRFNYVATTQY